MESTAKDSKGKYLLTMNLYKVYNKAAGKSAYTVAECQQEAVDKFAQNFECEDKFHLTVEYVSEVFV